MTTRVAPTRTTAYRVRVVGLPNAAAAIKLDVVPIATTTTVTERQSGVTLTLTGAVSETRTRGPLANVSVPVQVKWYGASAWTTLGEATSTITGTLGYTYRMTTRAGTFRFAYPGSPGTYAPATAASVFVKVPTKVTATVRRGSPNTLTAIAATSSGTRLGSVLMRLQRRTSTRAWASVAGYQASATGVAVAKTRPGRRTYYRWVLPATATRNRAVSGTVMVYR